MTQLKVKSFNLNFAEVQNVVAEGRGRDTTAMCRCHARQVMGDATTLRSDLTVLEAGVATILDSGKLDVALIRQLLLSLTDDLPELLAKVMN